MMRLLSVQLYFCDSYGVQFTRRRGAIYFAYHQNFSRAMVFLYNAAASAKSLKKFHPNLHITLFSNLNISRSDLNGYGFDGQIVIPIPAIIERQWWTRLTYLNHTPYEFTLSIDSDRFVCNDISEGFNILMYGHRGKSYDLLEVSAGILPSFDNGVMFFRKGRKFNHLIQTWMRFQTAWNKYGDDQGCLAHALEFIATRNDSAWATLGPFNVGVLPPRWQVKHIPVVGQVWGNSTVMRTLVISGDVKIIAGSSSCEKFSPLNDTKRRIYSLHRDAESSKNVTIAAFYSQEDCNRHLQNRCPFSEIDWTSPNYLVRERREYISQYYRNPKFQTTCELPKNFY